MVTRCNRNSLYSSVLFWHAVFVLVLCHSWWHNTTKCLWYMYSLLMPCCCWRYVTCPCHKSVQVSSLCHHRLSKRSLDNLWCHHLLAHVGALQNTTGQHLLGTLRADTDTRTHTPHKCSHSRTRARGNADAGTDTAQRSSARLNIESFQTFEALVAAQRLTTATTHYLQLLCPLSLNL